MEEFIWQQQKTATQHIATRSLLDLCEGLERAPRAQVGMWWWDQAGINMAATRELAAAVAENDRGE